MSSPQRIPTPPESVSDIDELVPSPPPSVPPRAYWLRQDMHPSPAPPSPTSTDDEPSSPTTMNDKRSDANDLERASPPPYPSPRASPPMTARLALPLTPVSPFRPQYTNPRPPLKHSRSIPSISALKSYFAPRKLRRVANSEPAWIALYFVFNLGLTLFNKLVLVRFPFPYTLTAIHAFFGSAGAYAAMEMGFFTPARLTPHESVILTLFSLLYTVNIAVSNISLNLVSVPLHQVVRAATPLFVIALSVVMLRGATASPAKLAALVPVIAGVALATYGDYSCTFFGFLLTVLGVVLAAFKTILTNILQKGPGAPPPSSLPAQRTGLMRFFRPARPIKLHPLDLLMRMCPLAFVQCVLYAHLSGELERVRRYGATEMTTAGAWGLLGNGLMALGLNIVSFTANGHVGPLAMTVAANVKQAMTIGLAVVMWNVPLGPMGSAGVALTLGGGAWYAGVEYREKRRRRNVMSLTRFS